MPIIEPELTGVLDIVAVCRCKHSVTITASDECSISNSLPDIDNIEPDSDLIITVNFNQQESHDHCEIDSITLDGITTNQKSSPITFNSINKNHNVDIVCKCFVKITLTNDGCNVNLPEGDSF